jgi:hypothetical protein
MEGETRQQKQNDEEMRKGTVRRDARLKGKNEEVKCRRKESHLGTGKEIKKERTATRAWRKMPVTSCQPTSQGLL